jgi:hypothetical protein
MTSRAQVEALPDCDDTSMLLAAFTHEQAIEDQEGWGRYPTVDQFLSSDSLKWPAREAATAFLLRADQASISATVTAVTGVVHTIDPVRDSIRLPGVRYLGLGVVHEVFVGPDRDEARLLRALTRDGRTFHIIRFRGEEPQATRREVIVGNDLEIDSALRSLNDALIDVYTQSPTP